MYERMLSQSLDKHSPRWKPLHVPASYKSMDRRIAKQMAKTNWFKSREEQGKEKTIQPAESSRRKEKQKETGENIPERRLEDQLVGEHSRRMEGEGTDQNEYSRRMDGEGSTKRKVRGPGREKITLGGKKRLEKAARKKEKRKSNRQEVKG